MKNKKEIVNKNIISRRKEAEYLLMRCDVRNRKTRKVLEILRKITDLLCDADKKDIALMRNYMEIGRINESTGKTVDEVVARIDKEFNNEMIIIYNILKNYKLNIKKWTQNY